MRKYWTLGHSAGQRARAFGVVGLGATLGDAPLSAPDLPSTFVLRTLNRSTRCDGFEVLASKRLQNAAIGNGTSATAVDHLLELGTYGL